MSAFAVISKHARSILFCKPDLNICRFLQGILNYVIRHVFTLQSLFTDVWWLKIETCDARKMGRLDSLSRWPEKVCVGIIVTLTPCFDTLSMSAVNKGWHDMGNKYVGKTVEWCNKSICLFNMFLTQVRERIQIIRGGQSTQLCFFMSEFCIYSWLFFSVSPCF